MIPKIEFRYSKVYDDKWRKGIKKANQDYNYPSPRAIVMKKNKVETLWKKKDKEILEEIAKVTKMDWKTKKFIVYFIGAGNSFGDPITISLGKKSIEKLLATIIHELIHAIMFEPGNKVKTMIPIQYYKKRYKIDSEVVLHHILVYSVMIHLSLRFSIIEDQKYFKPKKHKDYLKSWKIVEKEGYENILKKFKKNVKM